MNAHQASRITPPKPSARRRAAGLSLVELLVSLAIVALLLSATMVAIDASFRAYASAAESASTQTATRMVTHRLLTLVRTSTAHGPLEPSVDATWPVTLTGDTLESRHLTLIDNRGNELRIEYRPANDELWLIKKPFGGGATVTQPLLSGVTAATFHALRRQDSSGVWVLERASVDITVQPDTDATLAIESANTPASRVVASTMPRRLN